MEGQPLVVVVVPVHNNKEDTAAYLESLKGVNYANLKIVVVDDGSTDGTAEMLQKDYPEVIVLHGDGNLWFSAATNWGIEKAKEIGAEYVLLGDNDSIIDPDFITALVSTAERNPRSIICAKALSYYEPNRIQEAGGDMNWLKGGRLTIGEGELDGPKYEVEREVKYATMGLLIKTSFFDELGLLDAKAFPQYKSDVDFTYRAYKRGYRIIFQPKAKVYHKGGATFAHKNVLSMQKLFLRSPFSFIGYCLSKKSRRTGLSFWEFARFYLRHYPFYFPYILVFFALRRLYWEVKYIWSKYRS